MRKNSFIFLFGILSMFMAFPQQTLIKGSVKDVVTNEPIPDVTVTIEETSQSTKTDALGEFSFTTNLPLGEQVLKVSKNGYLTARYPIVVNEGSIVNITDMFLQIDVSESVDLFTIALSDDELNDDMSGADNISGLLQSSRDVFLRTAAFEFSSSFFKVRGLGSENGTVLINGIEMNKMFNGRPQWSNWGGLNDVLRNQELANGSTPSTYSFGGILGITNINVRASQYKKGGRLTYSSSNRSYTNRVMASYFSGSVKGGWAYTLSAGRRWGDEGYQNATFYEANSFFVSVEKKLDKNHSINATGIFAPNRRGKSSPNSQEIYDLKDIAYNEYWGWHDGEKRNSRVKRVVEPIAMLNHYWTISDKAALNTNFAYQFGELGNSRIDYAGGANPSPAYYQSLPSYFLADSNSPDYDGAYLAEQNFLDSGQINWNRIYDANITNTIGGLNAAYVLYEDRSDDKQFIANTILDIVVNDNIFVNGSLSYKKLRSENFAEITDLLEGTGYLNVDSFDGYQYNLQDPDRIVGEGEKFRYNYNLTADVIGAYAQAQFKYYKIDFYLAGNFSNTQYQREGLFQHEAYEDNSFGKGQQLKFNGLGGKAGFTYKYTGKHLIDVNAAYIIKAPSLRNTYTNSRENHEVVGNRNGVEITEEKIAAADASYIYRSPIVKARLTAYYVTIEDANEISFFFADGVGGDNTAFVQEILQGINKKHIGAELGIEAQLTPTIKLKGAASVGQYTYDNNPNLYLTSDDFDNGYLDFGVANLKDYKIAGGPQRAYSVGFEYSDPDYWWFGATTNFFTNTYIDVNPLTRTENFYLDNDGFPFNDYDENIARELLKQEKFDDYLVVNAIGGKSWKIGDYYVGFFASINNILDKQYKTGGFEQGRNANYRELRDDAANPKRVFGPKYWYGRGTTYFVNVNIRF